MNNSQPQNLLVDLIRFNWPIGLNEIKGHNNLKVSEWMKKGDFELDREITNSDEFLIKNYTKSFLMTNAYEIEKMACASLETMISLDHEKLNQKSLAWIIIKLYYSAFYAANTLMRCTGRLCIHIDGDTATKFCRNSRIFYPESKKPNTGYYLIKYDSINNEIAFSRDVQGNGSHHFLWLCLLNMIKEILSQSSNKSTVYQPYILTLLDFQEAICQRGNNTGNWLSVIRNDVNYKLEFGVWYPNKTMLKNYEIKILNNIDFSKDLSTIDFNFSPKEELVNFVKAVSFINTLVLDVMSDLLNRNSSKRSFLKKEYNHIYGHLDRKMMCLKNY